MTSFAVPSAASEESKPLDNSEISARFKDLNFPELEQCWRDFCAQDISAASITEKEIEESRRKHMDPFMGAPFVVLPAAVAGAAATYPILGTAVKELNNSLPEPIQPIAEGLYFANIAVLLVAGAVSIQRYGLHPFSRLMANEAGSMLCRPDFRAHCEQTQRFTEAKEKLSKLGISEDWDNPHYDRAYRSTKDGVEEVKCPSAEEIIITSFRELLGYKDEALRRHVPGRYTPALINGKKSVTEIVKLFGDEISQARQGSLPPEKAISIFERLRDEYCRKESDAHRFLSNQIASLATGNILPEHCIKAAVWARNPWVDLTSQKEFFSSASLRSGNIFEAGSKGRLGTFGYLHNPAVTCLDFWNQKGRCVRARMLAATAQIGGSERSVLFIDGVEGTNSIRPQIVKVAIEQYARQCGFDAVAYNSSVHNRTPRAFVNYLGETGVKEAEVLITAIDTKTREYLDAFGYPLQPFEYQRPQGKVLARVVMLSDSTAELPITESISGKLHRFMQRKLLYLLFADAVGFAALASAQVSGGLTVALLAASGAGLYANEWYKRRSDRAAKQT